MEETAPKNYLWQLIRSVFRRKRPTWREKMLEIMDEEDINSESEQKFKFEYECGRGWRCENGYPKKHDSCAFRLGFEDEVHDRPAPIRFDQF